MRESGSASLLARHAQQNRYLIGKALARTALNSILLGARHKANTVTQEPTSGK